MKRCHDRTLHTTLHKKPMEMRATCCCWGGKERGNVEGIQKYSFIVSRPQDEALRWAELPCVVVGRGLYALYLKPHQSSGPCVMWSGLGRKEGSLMDSPEPPLKRTAGMGGQWCKAVPGNKQLWLRVWRLLHGGRPLPPWWQQCVSLHDFHIWLPCY